MLLRRRLAAAVIALATGGTITAAVMTTAQLPSSAPTQQAGNPNICISPGSILGEKGVPGLCFVAPINL